MPDGHVGQPGRDQAEHPLLLSGQPARPPGRRGRIRGRGRSVRAGDKAGHPAGQQRPQLREQLHVGEREILAGPVQ